MEIKWNSLQLLSYKNVLKINLMLLWAIFVCFLIGPFHFPVIFHKLPDVQHTTSKFCSHIQNRTEKKL